jgi:hypothetical protein
MEWPLLGNVQALDLRVPVSPVMATQLKAKNTVYCTVRPEFIYLGLEFRYRDTEIRRSRDQEIGVPREDEFAEFKIIVGESEFRV